MGVILLLSFGRLTGQPLTTVKVPIDEPIILEPHTMVLRTTAHQQVDQIVPRLNEFKKFEKAEIALDEKGEFNYWFMFSVVSEKAPLFLSLPMVQNFEIALYRLEADSSITLISKGGIFTPIEEKYIQHSKELFNLQNIPGESGTYLMKINRMLFRSFSARVFTPGALIRTNQTEFTLEGILMGVIFCVVLYHLLIFFLVRDAEYLLLAVYMFSLIVQISTYTGFSFAYLQFENTRWNHIFYNTVPYLSAIFSFWFSYKFLSINRKNYPKVTYTFFGFLAILGLGFLCALFQVPQLEQLIYAVSVPASLFLFGVGILRYKEKFKPAGVYVIAYIPTFLAIPYLALYAAGSISYDWFTHNTLLISIAMQAILFSLATAAKIKSLKNQNEELLQQENKALEEKVHERTAELHVYLQELKAEQEVKDKLLAIVSHDLRGPVSAISGTGQLIPAIINDGSTEELAEAISVLEKTSSQLSRQLDDLLQWVSIEMKEFPYNPVSINIHDMITELFEVHGSAAHMKNITLLNSVSTDDKIWADSPSTYTIFRNLINNAIKFSHKKGVIEVSAQQMENRTVVIVKDTGIGISADQIENIYDLSRENTYGTSGEKGIGLGLTIVREFTRLNKGWIELESTPGEGTSFSITLPNQST